MGRKDEMVDPAKVEASYQEHINGPNTKLIWYESGHKLPSGYVQDAMAWLEQHL